MMQLDTYMKIRSMYKYMGTWLAHLQTICMQGSWG